MTELSVVFCPPFSRNSYIQVASIASVDTFEGKKRNWHCLATHFMPGTVPGEGHSLSWRGHCESHLDLQLASFIPQLPISTRSVLGMEDARPSHLGAEQLMHLAALSVLALITPAGRCWKRWRMKQDSLPSQSARRCQGAGNRLGSSTCAAVTVASAVRTSGRAAFLLLPLARSLFPD